MSNDSDAAAAVAEREAPRPDRGIGPVLAPVELRLETFQGPLDLLLSLIEKRKLPITAVSLAEVTDQYLSYVRSLPQLDADLLADFLVVAARLLMIKSRAILPGQQEEQAEEDPAEDLAARLQEYVLFRAAAQYLQTLEQSEARCHPHPPRQWGEFSPPPLEPIQPTTLAAALGRVLERELRRAKPSVEITRLVRATVESRIALVVQRLEEAEWVEWASISGDTVDEIVATFLAVLELLRRGRAQVSQDSQFGNIVVSRLSL